MMTQPDADAALVERVKQGDQRAFELLVVKYQRRIERLIGRMVRDTDLVPDIAQETFIRAYRALPNFRGESAFYTWLYRIAVNTALDWTGKRKRRPVHLADDLGVLESRYDETETRRPPAPDAAMLLEERARVTRSILEELSPQYKAVLVLREFEDLSYLEIAEALQCSLGTVESRLFRARAQFRGILERRHPELLS